MGKHESIKDKAKPSASKDEAAAKPIGGDTGAASATTDDSARAVETVKSALATIDAIKIEAPMMALASIEAPKIAPSLDMPLLDLPKSDLPKEEKAEAVKAGEKAAPDAEAEPAASHPNLEAPPPRVNRFTLLAASLVMCAAFGAMIGALVAAGVTRPVPVASFAPTEKVGGEDINALKEQIVQARVDLANLKASIDAGNRNASSQFSKISERVERMERVGAEPVAKLNKAIEAFERRADHAKAAKEATGSITPPAPIVGTPKDSARPSIVDGWVLRDVERGTAIIEGRIGLVEVDQGDVVPGVGRVEAIRKQDGRWVVVTPKGLIVAPR